MTYPTSTDVTAGQPTAASHYNNLRADALRFGQSESAAVNLGAMLARYENNLNLVPLSTNRVRVEASPTSPVSLVIDGCPVRTITNIDLPTTSAPSGTAATWYIFAVAAATSFTLAANTSPTEYTSARRIGSCYWDGSAIVAGSIVTDYRSYLVDLLQYAPPQACQGRLTLTSGTPLQTAAATGGTVYFSPFTGQSVDIYAPGHGWVPCKFDELSLSFSTAAAGDQFDILACYSGGTLALDYSQWSNNTARANAVSLQNGRWVLTTAPEYLLLGTVRAASAGNIAHTLTQRFISNVYNTRPHRLFNGDSTAYTYASATIRVADLVSSNMVEAVFPTIWHSIDLYTSVLMRVGAASAAGFTYIGVDTTTADCSTVADRFYGLSGNTAEKVCHAFLSAYYPTPGYHYFPWLEATTGASVSFNLYAYNYGNCIAGVINV